MTERMATPTELLQAFGVTGEVGTVARLGGGHIHRTFLIPSASGDFVAQALNGDVFRDLDACEENLSRIDRHLSAGAPVSVPALLRTAEGRVQWTDPSGTTWRVSRFAVGTHPGTIVATAEQAFDAAHAFGSYVRVLLSMPGGPLRETLPKFHDLERRRSDFEGSVFFDRAGRRSSCQAAITRAFDLLNDPDVGRSLDRLPQHAVHNDAKVANLRFDADGRACMVVDLDTTMPGSVLFDLGELLRTATGDAAEDETDLARIELDDERIAAVVSGFVEGARDAIDDDTLGLAGIAGARLALENSIRMLGDHLDGDRYYAIDREGQNLDRARAQLRVAELLLERRSLIDAAARAAR